MANKGAEARPLETGPEQQPQAPKGAKEGVDKKDLEKGIGEVKGILAGASPEQMVAEPAAMETLPALEPSRWEQVRGWAKGIAGKMREAFKKPVPPTLEQLHQQQEDYIADFLDTAKLSQSDRDNLREVIMMQVDANEKDPKVIAERMKTVLDDHNARMAQMDTIAKAMQSNAGEEEKRTEVAQEMVKLNLDPETSKTIAKVYAMLGTLKPNMSNPDARARMEWDLLTNPKALADYLRARIPGGKTATELQIESLARAVALTIESQNVIIKNSPEEIEKRQKAEEKLRKVAMYVNKYPDVSEPDEKDIDTFLQKMQERENKEKTASPTKTPETDVEKATRLERQVRGQAVNTMVQEGGKNYNLAQLVAFLEQQPEKIIQDEKTGINSRIDNLVFARMASNLRMLNNTITNELVTVTPDGELKVNADPIATVRNGIFALEQLCNKDSIPLMESSKFRLTRMLMGEVMKATEGKQKQLAQGIPESQKGKRDVMVYLQGERAALEAYKTDRLQSIDTLLSQNLSKADEKTLDERRKEIEVLLSLDKDFGELQKKGWAEIGPDNKRRLTSKGLIGLGAPHWKNLPIEQRARIEELQHEASNFDKNIQANNEKLSKIHEAYEKKQDQVVDGLSEALNGLTIKYKDQPIDEEAKKLFLDLVKANLAENKMPDLYEELAKHVNDYIDKHNSNLVTLEEEEEPIPLSSDLLQEETTVVKQGPDAIKATLEKIQKAQGSGIHALAETLETAGDNATADELMDDELKLNEFLRNAETNEDIIDIKNPFDEKIVTPLGEILASVKETLTGQDPALYQNIEQKITQMVEKQNQRLSERINQETKMTEDLNRALDKVPTAKGSGIPALAEALENSGNSAIADELMIDDVRLAELLKDAEENEDIIATENIAEEGSSNRFSEILTSIKETLSVYPPVSQAVEKKVRAMVDAHNKKIEATIASEQEPPAMAA